MGRNGLPGFCAEHGLYRSTVQYRTVGSSVGTQGAGESDVVVPAQCLTATELADCEAWNKAHPRGPMMPCNAGACLPGWECCDHECANLTWDYSNCGACGNVCTCCGGDCCEDITYERGGRLQTERRGCCTSTGATADANGSPSCVPLLPSGQVSGEPSNIYNCGVCGTACPSSPNAIATCINGQCHLACAPGYTNCSTSGGFNCVNLQTDLNNCGECGDICGEFNPNAPWSCCSGGCTVLTGPWGIDNLNCGSCGNVCEFPATCQNGSCVCPTLPPPPPTPGFPEFGVPGGLLGNSNYWFTNALIGAPGALLPTSSVPIEGLFVSVTATEPMVTDNGFSIQLNAWNPTGNTILQQYGFVVANAGIWYFIETFEADGTTEIVCDGGLLAWLPIHTPLGELPGSNTLPAGYNLTMFVDTDGSGNVSDVDFWVNDPHGNQVNYVIENIAQQGCTCTGPCTGFQPGDLSPISAFTLNIVGPGNGAATTFSPGAAGIIFYSTPGAQLTANNNASTESEVPVQTVENSNLAYGSVQACPASGFSQSFFTAP
jgi:hypothetical protein